MSTAEIQPVPATTDVRELVVGFDLDMTLIDSRPGIQAVWDLLVAETGVPIDTDLVVSRLGPPLSWEMANWFPPEQVDAMVARYREHYPSHAITGSLPLPGVVESLAAVRALQGRTMVVSAKYTPSVLLHLEHLGLDVDEPVGDLHGAEKGIALREHQATIFVGDHTADVDGARAAGAVAVSVATGPFSADELRAYGADVVLNDLTEFPAWLDAYVLEQRLEALMERLARFADSIGVRHVTPPTHEMDREGYQANAGDRCYFCKAELVETLQPIADEFGITAIATGTNADDAIAGFRPGIRAAFERGAITPLKDARLTKAQIREASRSWGLETSDKPAAACLSSRIAYGIRITPNLLARVDRAEHAVRSRLTSYGIENVRVRDLGETASIEIDKHLLDQVDHAELVDAVVAEGFPAAQLDPRGFRSGSMNEKLKDPEKYR